MFFSKAFKWIFFWVAAPMLFGPSVGRFHRMQFKERKPWESYRSFAAFWYLFNMTPEAEEERREAILEASLPFLSQEICVESQANLEDCLFVIENTESKEIWQQAFQYALCYVKTKEQFERVSSVAYRYFGFGTCEAKIIEEMERKMILH